MKFTQYKKLTSIIALALISSSAYSAINIFTPTGGAFTVDQTQEIFWDMTSNRASTSGDNSYVGRFFLTYHGDFHHYDYMNGITDIGSAMVVSSGTAGVQLYIGDVIGSSRTYSTQLYTGTTSYSGTMTTSPATTAYYGLKFLIGSLWLGKIY